MLFPDLFPFGMAGENLAARLSAFRSADLQEASDGHQLRDLELHLQTYLEHREGMLAARERGDLYNAVVESIDAGINVFFAWAVASRIVDPALRSQAFGRLNATVV